MQPPMGKICRGANAELIVDSTIDTRRFHASHSGDLSYVVCEISYGGHVTDLWDMRTLHALFKTFFTPEFLQPDFSLTPDGDYQMPDLECTHEQMQEAVKKLPPTYSPALFRLHPNAAITYQQRETKFVLNTLIKLQASAVSSRQKKKKDDEEEEEEEEEQEEGEEGDNEIKDDQPTEDEEQQKEPLLTPQTSRKNTGRADPDHVPPMNPFFSIRTPGATPASSREDSSHTRFNQHGDVHWQCLHQEAERFNKLLVRIHSSLSDLESAVCSVVVMSSELEMMSQAFLVNQVPEIWSHVAYPSLKPLSSWIEHGEPPSFLLPGFFFPQAFLTGVLQTHARLTQIAIDTLSFNAHVMASGQVYQPRCVSMSCHLHTCEIPASTKFFEKVVGQLCPVEYRQRPISIESVLDEVSSWRTNVLMIMNTPHWNQIPLLIREWDRKDDNLMIKLLDMMFRILKLLSDSEIPLPNKRLLHLTLSTFSQSADLSKQIHIGVRQCLLILESVHDGPLMTVEREEFQTMESTLTELRKKTAELKKHYKKQAFILIQTQEKMQKAEEDRTKAERDRAQMEEEKKKAEEERTKAEADRAQMEEEKKKAEEERTKAEADRAQMEEEKKKAEEERTKAEADRAQMEEEKKKAEEERTKAEADRAQMEEEKKKAEEERTKAEADRAQMEEEKKKAEEERTKAEADRAQMEEEKKKAEEERTKAEADRAQMEEEKKKAEEERTKAEADRAQMEEEKKKAEEERTKAEADRAQMEEEKKKAEEERTKAEADRAQMEEEKKKAEEERTKAEADRAQMEEEKKKAEEERTKAEADRAQMEEEKKKAEEERTKAEADRAQMEEEKKKAEEERTKAEADRAQMEEEKKKAEEERTKAEADRAQMEEEKKKAEEERTKAEADRAQMEEEKKKAEEERTKAEADRAQMEEEKKKAEETNHRALKEVRSAKLRTEKENIQLMRISEDGRLALEADRKMMDEWKNAHQSEIDELTKRLAHLPIWLGTKSLLTFNKNAHRLTPTTLTQIITFVPGKNWRTTFTFPMDEGEWELKIKISHETPRLMLGFLKHPLRKDATQHQCGLYATGIGGDFTLWDGGMWKGGEFKPAGTNKMCDRAGQTAAIRVNMSTREARLFVDDEEQSGIFPRIPSPLCLGITTGFLIENLSVEVLWLKRLRDSDNQQISENPFERVINVYSDLFS
ncbi:putative Dynein axonemal heavy chain 6 [Blattamonas nauphoetae]|uniref:Dynein axonemal heavy chain 6 n=1 Tax=Blattamonas nauphoetae TaxID=2049346 RepID=A0ABQ9WYI2_9EUKA|nr:putative Dynein axonemal heavy chain 6 [Blattamonas nauphoetae]